MRLNAARLILGSPATFDHHRFAKRFLPKILGKDIFETAYHKKLELEERTARMDIVLLLCSALVQCDSIHTRYAVSEILSLTRQHSLTTGLSAVMDQLSSEILKKGSCKQLIEPMLAEVFFDFVEKGLPYTEFPVSLFNIDSAMFNTFLNRYEKCVVPVILLSLPTQEVLEDLCTRLTIQPETLLQRNLLRLLQLSFLGIVAQEHNKMAVLKNGQKMAKLGDLIQKFYRADLFGMEVVSNAPGLISFVFSHINDTRAMERELEVSNSVQVRTGLLECKYDLAEEAIQFLTELTNEDIYLWLYSRSTKSIPEIGVDICLNLNTEHRQTQLRCLHSLLLWLKNLFSGSSVGQIKGALPFLFKFISGQLLVFIGKTDDSDCRKAALIVLQKFVAQLIVSSVESIQNCIQELNTCLIATIVGEADSNVRCKAKEILEFLLVENFDQFTEFADKLEEYPDAAVFSALTERKRKATRKQSLEDLIRIFLVLTKRVEDSFCNNILKQLNSRLGSSTYEFSCLIDNDKELVAKLIQQLLQVSKTKVASISSLAMECLGKIGPLKIQLCNRISSERVCQEDPSRPALAYIHPILDNLRHLLKLSTSSFTKEVFNTLVNLLSETPEGRELGFTSNDLDLVILRQRSLEKGKKNLSNMQVLENEARFNTELDDPLLWTTGQSYDRWIKLLVNKLLLCMSDKSVLGHVRGICKKSTSFCELVFPFIIHECLLSGNENIRAIMSGRICAFFKEIYDACTIRCDSRSSTPIMGQSDTQNLDRQKVLLMVNTVKYLRLQELPPDIVRRKQVGLWERNFWIMSLDYIHVAQAALTCADYVSALAFAEIWLADYQLKSKKEVSLATICQNEPEMCGKLRKIISVGSFQLGWHDQQEGIKVVLPEPGEIESRLENMPLLDIKASQALGDQETLITGLYETGMFHVLASYLKASPIQEQSPRIKDIQAECSWRLGEWDKDFSDISSFNASVFTCIQGKLKADKEQVRSSLDNLQYCIKEDLNNVNIETSFEVYSILSRLKQIGELRVMTDEQLTKESLVSVLADLNEMDRMYCTDFSKLEPTYTMRLCLLDRISLQYDLDRRSRQAESLRLCQKAREAGCFQLCNRILEKTDGCEHVLDFKFEKSKLEWDKGNATKAIQLAKSLVQEIATLISKGPDAVKIHPELLVTLGQWVDFTKSEPSNTVICKYYKEAVVLQEAEAVNDENSLLDAHLGLAKLTDQHYRKLEEQIGSLEFKERKKNITSLGDEVKLLKSIDDKDKAFKQKIIIKQRFFDMDVREVQRIEEERNEHLYTSVENYISVVKHGDNAVAVFRLISLWFANPEDKRIHNLMAKALPQIPSHRLVPLLYQMAARMDDTKGNKDANFHAILFNVILRCAIDHPHHVLPIILALKFANQDEIYTKKKANGKTSNDSSSVSGRSKASNELLLKVKKINSSLINNYVLVNNSLIEVAYEAVMPRDKGSVELKSSLSYVKIRNYTNVVVPTLAIPVRPDSDYSKYPCIQKFDPKFSMVGGINAPKKTSCLGTDGIYYSQLLKGQDDMRQDAVMQQVFGLTNQLLDKNSHTRDHNLKIRTYKIVPLSQRSGILQWCDGTAPLQTFLAGKEGVHERYFPSLLTYNEARVNYQKRAKDPEAAYWDICNNFPPAMRYVFMERCPSPELHQKVKLCFTKSVAANSMVGHILGLGDRHLNNILMDQVTGEIVHIDFGIAFDKGKILPTPELVPFRLTRDMVDGFGPAGVEGVFR